MASDFYKSALLEACYQYKLDLANRRECDHVQSYKIRFTWYTISSETIILITQRTIVSRQATSHYLDQCWPSSPTYICGTREIRVNVGNLFQPSNIMRYPHNALPTSHDSFLFIEMQINCKLIEDQQGSFHTLAYKDARNPLMQHSFLLIVVDYFITVVYKRYHSMNGWYFKPHHFFNSSWPSTTFVFPHETVRKIDAYAFTVIYKKHVK